MIIEQDTHAHTKTYNTSVETLKSSCYVSYFPLFNLETLMRKSLNIFTKSKYSGEINENENWQIFFFCPTHGQK